MNAREIISLPVYTESETFLGTIIELDIDPKQQTVEFYFVKKIGIATTIFHTHNPELADYKIHASQVVSIQKDRMIVDDLSVEDKIKVAESITPMSS